MTKVRIWTAAVVLVPMVALLLFAGSGAQGQAVEDEVPKIAAALKNGDKDAANKLATAYRKKAESLEGAMDLFKKKPGGIGIELIIRQAAGGQAKFAKDADKWEALAWNIAAIGLIAEHFTPAKDKGKGTVRGWKVSVADLQAGTAALAKAKTNKDLKTAATKINNACIGCHAEWRTGP